jgi:hypothetical protein
MTKEEKMSLSNNKKGTALISRNVILKKERTCKPWESLFVIVFLWQYLEVEKLLFMEDFPSS